MLFLPRGTKCYRAHCSACCHLSRHPQHSDAFPASWPTGVRRCFSGCACTTLQQGNSHMGAAAEHERSRHRNAMPAAREKALPTPQGPGSASQQERDLVLPLLSAASPTAYGAEHRSPGESPSQGHCSGTGLGQASANASHHKWRADFPGCPMKKHPTQLQVCTHIRPMSLLLGETCRPLVSVLDT